MFGLDKKNSKMCNKLPLVQYQSNRSEMKKTELSVHISNRKCCLSYGQFTLQMTNIIPVCLCVCVCACVRVCVQCIYRPVYIF